MNRILFAAEELAADGSVLLEGRRADHVRRVLRAREGDLLRVGVLDGGIGAGRVEAVTAREVRLAVNIGGTAPAPWIDLLLAVPRPKALKRLWPQLAALGVGRVILINAARVERCYFDTRWVEPAAYEPLLLEGLEQAGTTRRPEVWLRRRFKPFMEDELEAHYGAAPKLLAHPGAPTPPPTWPATARPLLAIGPEGGWKDYELEQMSRRGFTRCALGTRTLRTDTACLALLGRLLPA